MNSIQMNESSLEYQTMLGLRDEIMESLRTEIQLKNEIIKQKDTEIETLKEQFTTLISNIQKSLGKVTLFNNTESAMEKSKRKTTKKIAEPKESIIPVVDSVEITKEDNSMKTETHEVVAETPVVVTETPVEKPKKKYTKKAKDVVVPAAVVETAVETPVVVAETPVEKPKKKYTKKAKEEVVPVAVVENATETPVVVAETPVEKPKKKYTKKPKADTDSLVAGENSIETPKRKYTKKPKADAIAEDETVISDITEKSQANNAEKPKRKYNKKPKEDIQVEVVKPAEVVEIPVVQTKEIVEELTNESYEDNDEEISAYDFEIDGVQYLIDDKNNVYDKDTYVILGVYNEETNTIE
jgi:hypothetical protein